MSCSLNILTLIALKFRGANWKSRRVVRNTMKFGKRTCSLEFDQQMFKKWLRGYFVLRKVNQVLLEYNLEIGHDKLIGTGD